MRRADLAGAAHLELVSGVVQLRPEDAMFEAMLRGWRAQQTARGLREDTIGARERLMRRFGEFTNEYPWNWVPAHVDEWTLSLTAEQHLAPSTIRGYQTNLRLFSEYLCDARYGWVAACEKRVRAAGAPGADLPRVEHDRPPQRLRGRSGSAPVHPRGVAAVPRLRRRAGRARGAGKRKGALAAYRDATLFKVVYGWGLRRTETSKLDVVDWGRNPAAPEFGAVSGC